MLLAQPAQQGWHLCCAAEINSVTAPLQAW